MLGCTVDELGQRMSVAEFAEWEVMERVEGLGLLGQHRRHGEVLAALATGALQHPHQLRRWQPHELHNADPWAAAPDAEPADEPDLRQQIAKLNGRQA